MDSPVLFTCVRDDTVRITENGCAGLFRRARAARPERWHFLSKCLDCECGARHAGVELTPMRAERAPVRKGRTVPEPHAVLNGVCVRCGFSSERIVRFRVCVSCYNREREVLLGRNAKGRAPTKLKLAGIRVLAGNGAREMTCSFHTADADDRITNPAAKNPMLEAVLSGYRVLSATWVSRAPTERGFA
jgi:hypothetical protein